MSGPQTVTCGKELSSENHLKCRFCLPGIANTQLEVVVESWVVSAGLGIHEPLLHLLQCIGASAIHLSFSPASHPAHSPRGDEVELGWKGERPHSQGQVGFLLQLWRA